MKKTRVEKMSTAHLSSTGRLICDLLTPGHSSFPGLHGGESHWFQMNKWTPSAAILFSLSLYFPVFFYIYLDMLFDNLIFYHLCSPFFFFVFLIIASNYSGNINVMFDIFLLYRICLFTLTWLWQQVVER